MVIEEKEYLCEDCEQCYSDGREFCECGGYLLDKCGIRAEDDIEEELSAKEEKVRTE